MSIGHEDQRESRDHGNGSSSSNDTAGTALDGTISGSRGHEVFIHCILMCCFPDLSVCSFHVSDYLVLVRFVVVSDCVLVRLGHV